MRIPRLGVRHRVLVACCLISLMAVAALVVGGVAFRRILRARAVESCTRLAAVLEGIAHARLITLVGEATELADTLGRSRLAAQTGLAARPLEPFGKAVICAWAAYGPDGQRLASQYGESVADQLKGLACGLPHIAAREEFRFREALTGRATLVLAPHQGRLYLLHYQPVPRRGTPRLVLQVVAEMSESLLASPADTAGARAVLRPYVDASDKPRLVSVDGEPRLLVHRPLLCGGRQLGSIAVAVPYGAEARYERLALFAILAVVLGSLVILGLVSYFLTDVAMVPLDRVHRFVCQLQSGSEVERLVDIPKDEAGTFLEAYQQLIARSQDWADRIVEFSRAHQELLSGAVEALVSAIEAKDVYTAGHSQRVADRACSVARALHWDEAAIEELRLGAILHDIGKIGISQGILNKPNRLDAEEFETVRQHPVIGARILSSIPGCEDVVRTVLYHHERFDGKGYPTGTSGDAIPPAARLVALADVYDALTSRRSYRPAYPAEEAARILAESRGTMFDPELLDPFLEAVRRPQGTAPRRGSDFPAAAEGRGRYATEPVPTTTEGPP